MKLPIAKNLKAEKYVAGLSLFNQKILKDIQIQMVHF